MLITITDIRNAGHCVSGARAWFREYDIDFRDFLKNGIDSEVLLATGDALAEQVIQRKIERESADG
jgi:hypothetical protein